MKIRSPMLYFVFRFFIILSIYFFILIVCVAQTLGRAEPSLLLGHVLGPCAGWRTYLDARFWDSRLTGQFLPGLPMQEMSEAQVQLLGQEDPLEEKMATHSNVLAWKIP